MALDTDPTSDTFDALVSLEDAAAWHASRGYSEEWGYDCDDSNEKFIRWATNLILLDIVVLVDPVVPKNIANACAELAFLLSTDDLTKDSSFDSVKIGSVSITSSGSNSSSRLYSATVAKLLGSYLKATGFKRY